MVKEWVCRDRKIISDRLGSPQGSAISPTICNMVLDGLEIQIKKKYHKTKRDGKAYFPKVNFIRYADDFIVTGESRELLEAGYPPDYPGIFIRERVGTVRRKDSDYPYRRWF